MPELRIIEKSTLPCTPELRQKVKLEAAKRNITMTRLVERAVKKELEENAESSDSVEGRK